MACPVCLRAFNLREVRPKALPCGHSVCESCLGNIEQHYCSTCRAAFEMPRPDNFPLVEQLEAQQLEGPRGTWWCLDCNSPAATQCVEDHGVGRPKVALRLGVQDVVPRASQAMQGLQDGLQGLQDGAALTALRLLRGPPTTCRLTLRQDDGEVFGAEWRVEGKGAEDSLLQPLVVALAASGRLLQEPSGVHADAPPAAQQPAEDRIEELDLRVLSGSDPADRREDRAETLRLVRPVWVRRMTGLNCSSDPNWALDVLQSASTKLKELQMMRASEAHVAAVQAMPRLQRLDLDSVRERRPVELPALFRPSRLKWLRVGVLPLATTVSLLWWHAASLKVLWLRVDCRPGWDLHDGWKDLDASLGQCRLRLTRLVLWRYIDVHYVHSCRAQLEAVRRVLPECAVQRDRCDQVPLEAF